MAVTGQTHRIVIEGVAATIRLGYKAAATLGAWRVEGDVFSAKVVTADTFRLTQSPLVLEIPNRDGIPTRRSIDAVTVHQGQLSARLLKRGR